MNTIKLRDIADLFGCDDIALDGAGFNQDFFSFLSKEAFEKAENMTVTSLYLSHDGDLCACVSDDKAVDARPDWDTYFMQIAKVVATRSNCSRRHVAAVAVKNHRIVSTGYNGTPIGVKNCFEGGCPRCAGTAPSGEHLDDCICVHAEQNAICQAALYGISLEGATVYVTISPCLTCAKLLINAGVKEVVYGGDYRFTKQTEDLLKEAGVICRRWESK